MSFDFRLTITDGIIDEYLANELIDMGIDYSCFKRRKGFCEFYHTINETPCVLDISDLDFLSRWGTSTWREGFMLTLDCK